VSRWLPRFPRPCKVDAPRHPRTGCVAPLGVSVTDDALAQLQPMRRLSENWSLWEAAELASQSATIICEGSADEQQQLAWIARACGARACRADGMDVHN
jgi:hypothetical protein